MPSKPIKKPQPNGGKTATTAKPKDSTKKQKQPISRLDITMLHLLITNKLILFVNL